MNKIKLVDSSFSHSELGYSSDFQPSKIFKWDRENIDLNGNEDIVFTDNRLLDAKNKNNSIGWLIEPIEILPHIYSNAVYLKENFKKIYTHEKTLIDTGDPFELVPFGCCWIKPEDQKMYNKTKLVSIIASNKTQTKGHNLRHEAIRELKDKMDVFGRGYNEINYKLSGLEDYKFSVVIENCKRDYWFTEKLIDCLVTGTIPLYWGCPSIGDFFDVRGFFIFDTVNELKEIVENLTEESYNSKLEFVRKNFDMAKKYLLPDDIIYKKIKK
jgi:hypothetical protein